MIRSASGKTQIAALQSATVEMQLKDRVALITGATRDVGREVALSLAAEGATVAVHHRNSAEEAEAVVSDIRRQGGNARVYRADIADRAAVQAMIQSVVADHGALNILSTTQAWPSETHSMKRP
jgi:NAD(P)-dependent dehydrogenase (short-subunit alcohol dehydrogenase family)